MVRLLWFAVHYTLPFLCSRTLAMLDWEFWCPVHYTIFHSLFSMGFGVLDGNFGVHHVIRIKILRRSVDVVRTDANA